MINYEDEGFAYPTKKLEFRVVKAVRHDDYSMSPLH